MIRKSPIAVRAALGIMGDKCYIPRTGCSSLAQANVFPALRLRVSLLQWSRRHAPVLDSQRSPSALHEKPPQRCSESLLVAGV